VKADIQVKALENPILIGRFTPDSGSWADRMMKGCQRPKGDIWLVNWEMVGRPRLRATMRRVVWWSIKIPCGVAAVLGTFLSVFSTAELLHPKAATGVVRFREAANDP